jgi:undecaprenyl-phosphate galactose phosphotransferase
VESRGHVQHSPVYHEEWRGKRFLDIAGAIALGVIFLPVIVAVTGWLLLTGGSVLFHHRRIGRNGKRFTCYKFRTMVPNADRVLEEVLHSNAELRAEWILHHKLKDDPRITRIGYLLRKTSLDELPQLWNVLRGEMSLVGPRPIVEEEIFKYGRAIRHYLAVKPGITGLWQVEGRNDTSYRRRVALDRIYAARSCVGLDLRILVQTIGVVVGRRGAY